MHVDVGHHGHADAWWRCARPLSLTGRGLAVLRGRAVQLPCLPTGRRRRLRPGADQPGPLARGDQAMRASVKKNMQNTTTSVISHNSEAKRDGSCIYSTSTHSAQVQLSHGHSMLG